MTILETTNGQLDRVVIDTGIAMLTAERIDEGTVIVITDGAAAVCARLDTADTKRLAHALSLAAHAPAASKHEPARTQQRATSNEQIVADALAAGNGEPRTGRYERTLASVAVAALQAAGRLVGESTDEQREGLDKVIAPVLFNSSNYPEPHRMMGKSYAKLQAALVDALTAAGVAPHAPSECQNATETDDQGAEKSAALAPRAGHDLDRMGICRKCGQGISVRELLDGADHCTPRGHA